ncbi:MAG TPA: uroporphyrinogen-III C-methyltransferase [Methylomirabilota bacterium]|jgi:uroporphyrin-III C-methyltransferase|nr:uroporphyrinogen-III C-methyltransferase [Methylomirabilota bacterium]
MDCAASGRVVLVGAGPGDPELITRRGLRWLQRAEVVVYDQLVSPVLLDEAPPDALRIFAGKSSGNHCMPQAAINALLVRHALAGRLVVRLKGGDSFVFGRGGEEVQACIAAGVPFDLVPGVTAAVAVPAAAGIPVTHRGVASSFAVVTGHEDPSKPDGHVDWVRLAGAVDTIVVLMGTAALPEIVRRLLAAGRDSATPAAVIRRGTTDAEEVVTGTLADIARRAAHLSPPCTIVIGEVVRLRRARRGADVEATTQRAEGNRGGRFSRIAAAPSRTSSSMNVSISSAMD